MSREKELAEKHLIFKCIAGSRSYGTDLENSDTDVKGIFIAPPEYELGCFKKIEQVEDTIKNEVIYELDKFVKLAVQCNPNIIEFLFTDEKNILFIDPAFEILRKHRDWFLSTKAKHTFSGYAFSQLKRIKGHKRWISNPQPENPPSIHQFCTRIHDGMKCGFRDEVHFDDTNRSSILIKAYGENCFMVFSSEILDKDLKGKIISDDGLNFIYQDQDWLFKNFLGYKRFSAYRGVLICDLKKFNEARTKWKDYWSWKKNRNKDRAKLEEKIGYDGKHASHLVLLMRMAKEILIEGKVSVFRHDAKDLLEIRNGKMKYEELIKWASDMDKELNKLYEKSSLQEKPQIKKINQLIIDVKLDYWKKQGLLKSFLKDI